MWNNFVIVISKQSQDKHITWCLAKRFKGKLYRQTCVFTNTRTIPFDNRMGVWLELLSMNHKIYTWKKNLSHIIKVVLLMHRTCKWLCKGPLKLLVPLHIKALKHHKPEKIKQFHNQVAIARNTCLYFIIHVLIYDHYFIFTQHIQELAKQNKNFILSIKIPNGPNYFNTMVYPHSLMTIFLCKLYMYND